MRRLRMKPLVLGLSLAAMLCGRRTITAEWHGPLSVPDTEAVMIHGKPLAAWIQTLKNEKATAFVRCQAADELGKAGVAAQDALPALVAVSQDSDRGVAASARDALLQIDPGARTCLKMFLAELKNKDGRIRALGVTHLSSIAQEQPQVVFIQLTEALHDKEREVRHVAAIGLGRLGPKAGAAVPALIDALQDEDDEVRGSAAGALGNIGSGAKEAAVPLCYALRDDCKQVKNAAVTSLCRLTEDAKAAGVPVLLSNLEEKDGVTRLWSAYMLMHMKSEAKKAVLPLCKLMLYDGEAGHRFYATILLAEMGSDAKAAAPALLLAMKDEDQRVRDAAAEALAAIDPEAAHSVLNAR